MGKSGILYVVGTGPASSELMTLGAVRTLQKCPVIFYPVTQSKSGQQKSRALETIKGAVDLGKRFFSPLNFPCAKMIPIRLAVREFITVRTAAFSAGKYF